MEGAGKELRLRSWRAAATQKRETILIEMGQSSDSREAVLDVRSLKERHWLPVCGGVPFKVLFLTLNWTNSIWPIQGVVWLVSLPYVPAFPCFEITTRLSCRSHYLCRWNWPLRHGKAFVVVIIWHWHHSAIKNMWNPFNPPLSKGRDQFLSRLGLWHMCIRKLLGLLPSVLCGQFWYCLRFKYWICYILFLLWPTLRTMVEK